MLGRWRGWFPLQAYTQLASSKAGYTTYQLTVTLGVESRNMYALFGKHARLR